MRKHKIPATVVSEIISDYKAGKLTVKEIANRHEVSMRTVYNIIAAEGKHRDRRKADITVRLSKEEAITVIASLAVVEKSLDAENAVYAKRAAEMLREKLASSAESTDSQESE